MQSQSVVTEAVYSIILSYSGLRQTKSGKYYESNGSLSVSEVLLNLPLSDKGSSNINFEILQFIPN